MGVQKEHATSNPKSALGATGRLSWWSVRLLVLAQGCGMEARVGLRAWWGGGLLESLSLCLQPPNKCILRKSTLSLSQKTWKTEAGPEKKMKNCHIPPPREVSGKL